MGHNKAKLQNDRLKNALIKLVETNIAIMEFNLTLVNEKKDINVTKTMIKQGKKAIEIIKSVKHNEILTDLYNSFIVGNIPYFVAATRTIALPKKIKHWDTEKGFKDFIKERENAIAQYEKDQDEKKKERERIEQAKREGKNVELMYKDGKVRYVVVEEKAN